MTVISVYEELIRGPVKVEFTYIGEGIDGDYDKDDPEDVPLLRFDVSLMGADGWEEVSDSSYCTQVRADTPSETVQRLLGILMDEVFESVKDGHSVKRVCERLSWMDASYTGENFPEKSFSF